MTVTYIPGVHGREHADHERCRALVIPHERVKEFMVDLVFVTKDSDETATKTDSIIAIVAFDFQVDKPGLSSARLKHPGLFRFAEVTSSAPSSGAPHAGWCHTGRHGLPPPLGAGACSASWFRAGCSTGGVQHGRGVARAGYLMLGGSVSMCVQEEESRVLHGGGDAAWNTTAAGPVRRLTWVS